MKAGNQEPGRGGRRSFHVPGSSKHFPPALEYHTRHINLKLKIDLEAKTIQGSCTLTINISSATRPATLHFDAIGMQIEKVEVDGKNTRFEYDGETLSVTPEPRPTPGSRSEVTVWYSSKPKGGVYFVHPEEEYPSKPLQAWTQFEAEGARFCLPCRDFPDDKSTSEMVITVKEGFQMLSNGKLLSQETKEGWTTFHWKEDVPHSVYLNSFAIGKFLMTQEVTQGGVPLQYLFPESKKADAHRYFGLTPDMLKTFEEITGAKYPFEKYAQVAVHDFIYGGMENIGATTLTDTRFPDARSEEDYAARYSRPDRTAVELVSHELAHMWFGDLVTTRDWANAWLNEGFATYFEALYHERKFGVDDMREDLRAKAEVHFEEDEGRYRRAIVDNDYIYADDLFDTFLYEKAAWMLHQLRYMLGDETFFRGVGEYVSRFRQKSVDTHDFRRVMEETSDRSLEQYFQQSFYQAGHPEFEVEYSWDEGVKEASVTIRQAQATGEGTMTPIFSLPCSLVFYTKGVRVEKRVWVKNSEETYHFQLDSEPSIVEFDPEEWLLKKLKFKKNRSLLANQLSGSEDATSRRRAAEDLVMFKTPETIQLLKQAASREQHWTVRAEALRTTGKIGGAEALSVLLEMVGVRNRRVRRAAVAALAEFKGDANVQEVLKKVLFNDESPYVQCEAALSLGKTGGAEAIPTLILSMRLPSPEYGVTEASVEALGYVKTKEARELIRQNTPYGLPTRVRMGALKGYIRLGSLEDEDLRILKDIALDGQGLRRQGPAPRDDRCVRGGEVSGDPEAGRCDRRGQQEPEEGDRARRGIHPGGQLSRCCCA